MTPWKCPLSQITYSWIYSILWLLLRDRYTDFKQDINALESCKELSSSSHLVPCHPLLDSVGVLCVGGREQLSQRLLPKGNSSSHKAQHCCRAYVFTARRSNTCCIFTWSTFSLSWAKSIFHHSWMYVCRRKAAKPQSQLLGQLPVECIMPGPILTRLK